MKRSWCLVVAAIAIACATSESFAELSSNRPSANGVLATGT